MRGTLAFTVDQDGNPTGTPQVYVEPAFRRQGIATRLYERPESAGYDLSGVSGTGGFTDEGARLFHARVGRGAEAAPELAPEPDVVSLPLEGPDAPRMAPEVFQHKVTGDQAQSALLRNVQKWDPTSAGVVAVWNWRDPAADGHPELDPGMYVVNGHNRVAAAQRLRAEGNATAPDRLRVVEVEADSPGGARSAGALVNIREGRGSAVDAAKFFRESGIGPEDLRAEGVVLTEGVVRDGLALSRLHPTIFQEVATGRMPVRRAAIIGASGLTEGQQLSVLEHVRQRGERLTNRELGEFVRQVRAAPTYTETTTDLFGDQTDEQSLVVERAVISSHVRDAISQDRRLFGFLTRGGRSERIAGTGAGEIDTERAGEIAGESARMGEIYDRLSTRSGPISDVLNRFAKELADGVRPAAEIKQAALEEVRAAITEEIGQAQGDTGVKPADEGGQEAVGTGVQGDAFGPPAPAEGGERFGIDLPPGQRLIGETATRARGVVERLGPRVDRDVATLDQLEDYLQALRYLNQGNARTEEEVRVAARIERLRGEAGGQLRGQPDTDTRDMFGRPVVGEAVQPYGDEGTIAHGSPEAAASAGAAIREILSDIYNKLSPKRRMGAIERAKKIRDAFFVPTDFRVTDARQAAILLKPYRDPRFEFLHVLYLNDDLTVKAHSVHTLYESDRADQPADSEIILRAREEGVSRVVLVHNHPSGNPRPSPADLKVVRETAASLEGFGVNALGGVVIDHGRGYEITRAGEEIPFSYPEHAEDWTAKLSVKTTFPVMGRERPWARAAAAFVANARGPGTMALVYVDVHGGVIAVEPHAMSAVDDMGTWFEGRVADLGARGAYVVVDAASQDRVTSAVNDAELSYRYRGDQMSRGAIAVVGVDENGELASPGIRRKLVRRDRPESVSVQIREVENDGSTGRPGGRGRGGRLGQGSTAQPRGQAGELRSAAPAITTGAGGYAGRLAGPRPRVEGARAGGVDAGGSRAVDTERSRTVSDAEKLAEGVDPTNPFAEPREPIGGDLLGRTAPPIQPTEPVSAPQVVESYADVLRALGEPGTFRVGRQGRRDLGVYNTRTHIIRMRRANDLSTAAHELADALEHNIFGWPKGGPWKQPLVSGEMQFSAALGPRGQDVPYPGIRRCRPATPGGGDRVSDEQDRQVLERSEMKITYDPRTDSLSVIFRDGVPVAESDEEKPGVVLDYDGDGNLVSIEILDASTRVTNARRIEYQAAE